MKTLLIIAILSLSACATVQTTDHKAVTDPLSIFLLGFIK